MIGSIVATAVLLAAPLGAQEVEPAARRTELIAEWESLGYGMFIHYGMSTFTGVEIDKGQSPSETYAPTAPDVRQWIRTAREAGMKYAVLTAKHVAGHCLWDSEGYDYDVATATDKTDVIAAFMAACKAEGILPGVYYCILDGHNEGARWKAPVGPEYFALVKHHLEELHTRYPGIREQWIDITAKLSPPQRRELYALVKRLSPNCLVIMNQGFRDGVEIPPGSWPTDLANGERTLPPRSGHNPLKTIDGKTHYIPMEVCDTIGKHWFWQPDDPPKPARSLYRLYSRCRERRANLLLNVPPDKTGRIPKEHVDRLMELKRLIDNPELVPAPESLTFERPAKASNVYRKMIRYGADAAVDDDPQTRWATDDGVRDCWLEVDLGEEKRFNRAFLSEAYDRVQKFELQCRRGEVWQTFAIGGRIGKELSVEFEPVAARFVRLHVSEATGGPTIWEFQLFALGK